MTETSTPSAPWRPCFANPLLNLAVYLAVLAGAAIHSVVRDDAHFVYVILFIIASIWYGASCIWLATDGVPGIDARLASDAIMTCGIASLILHVAIAAYSVDTELARNKGFAADIARQVARLFVEGLLCAAAAPVIAMVLRFIEARKSSSADADTPYDASPALDEFAQQASGMALSMSALSTAIDDSAEGYEGAASRVAASLEALAAGVQEQSQLVTEQLADLDARIRVLNESVMKSSDDFSKVGNQIDEFAAKLQAGSALLNGLRDLIGSVDRFIRPNTNSDIDAGRP